MKESGVAKYGNALQQGGRHITGTDAVVSDGPFIEGKETIGGYYLYQAADLDAATEIAKGFPDFKYGGTVEVREIMVFE